MSASTARGARVPRLRVLAGGATEPPAPTPTPSDEELIQAFERGDREAAAGLYDRLIHVVEGTLYRVLGKRGDDHEDLVQSAFEQIMLTLARRRFARACSLRAWAATVTTNVALNVIRSRTRDRRFLIRGEDTEARVDALHVPADLERELNARGELQRVERALARMKPEHASTLILHDVLGHELAEIAVLTGVSVSAAQSRLFRSRAQLQRQLEQAVPSKEDA